MANKRARKIDSNHVEIRLAVAGAGYPIFDLYAVGDGIPDLLVMSKSGIFVFLEIKSQKGKLTPKELNFFEKFRGAPVHVVKSQEAALEIMFGYDSKSICD